MVSKSFRSKARWLYVVAACLMIAVVLTASVYLFAQRAKISPDLFVASDTTSGDWFGSAVDMYANSLVVTAYKADTSVKDAGAAYVFHRLENAALQYVQKITAPNAERGDEFGFDVTMNARWLAISRLAGFKDRTKPRTQGDVLVFERATVEESWVFHSRIQEPHAEAGNYFGFSLDLSGDFLAVGATYSQIDGVRSGAAYLVDLASAQRTVIPLKIPAATEADSIGSDVLFVDDRLFVGAPGTSVGGVAEVGAVHEFSFATPTLPRFLRTIVPAELLAEDRFGTSIANPTGHLVVGAGHWAPKGAHEVAWLYPLNTDTAVGTKITVPTQRPGDMLGFRASAHGAYFVLSAHLESGLSVPTAGAAHLFQIENDTARYVGRLGAEIPIQDDFFGVAIASGEQGVLVGAEKADQSGNGSGAAGYFSYKEFKPVVEQDGKK